MRGGRDAGSDQSILGHRQMDSPSQMTHTESGEFTDFSSPNLLVFESGGAHEQPPHRMSSCSVRTRTGDLR